MVRQHTLDSAVTDYEARIRYRLTLSLGRRRWGVSAPAAVEEQDARVQWQQPNNVASTCSAAGSARRRRT
ncbi:MAG: hypothetical protein MZU84_04940 [Sphingobacterium sp.]|nr:hypothetical protein [Sphingobacterium sp.]